MYILKMSLKRGILKRYIASEGNIFSTKENLLDPWKHLIKKGHSILFKIGKPQLKIEKKHKYIRNIFFMNNVNIYFFYT